MKQGKPIVVWMDRDQRVQDNWALLYAQQVLPPFPHSRDTTPCRMTGVTSQTGLYPQTQVDVLGFVVQARQRWSGDQRVEDTWALLYTQQVPSTA